MRTIRTSEILALGYTCGYCGAVPHLWCVVHDATLGSVGVHSVKHFAKNLHKVRLRAVTK